MRGERYRALIVTPAIPPYGRTGALANPLISKVRRRKDLVSYEVLAELMIEAAL
jgi:hypothetical protein